MFYKMILTFVILSTTQMLYSQSWQQVHKTEDERYLNVLSEGNTVYTVINDADSIRIFRSSDGGFNWDNAFTFMKINGDLHARSFSIIDNNKIIISYDDNGKFLLYQHNPKVTAEIQMNLGSKISTMKMIDEKIGILGNDEILGAKADKGELLYITRDGLSKTIQVEGVTEMRDVWCLRAENGDIHYSYVNYKDSVNCNYYVSSDFGETWNSYEVGEFEPKSMYFIDENIGWISGNRFDDSDGGYKQYSYIYKTTDAGITWSKQLEKEFDGYTDLHDIKFKDKNYGIASSSGQFSELYTTVDGGETWEEQNIEAISEENFPIIYSTITDKALISAVWRNGIYRKDFLSLSIEDEFDSEIKIYPNPVGNTLSIEGDNILPGYYTLKIVDLNGKKIMSKAINFNGKVTLPVQIPTGVYTVILNGKQTYTTKIIKK